jgi:hypothetical protein
VELDAVEPGRRRRRGKKYARVIGKIWSSWYVVKPSRSSTVGKPTERMGPTGSRSCPILPPDPPAVEVRHAYRTCPAEPRVLEPARAVLETRLQRLDSRKSIRERLPRIKIPQNPVVIAQKDWGLSQTFV